MYEINTHNLKLYILVSSIIFILTNGFPIIGIFTRNDNINQNKYENLKGDNFIMVNNNNNNYYDVNATVIKHSIMYNTKTEFFTGSIMLEYKNYIDSHQFCKIDIDIAEQRRNDVIYVFMYNYYNLSKNNIRLYCNNKICIHNLTTYVINDNYNGINNGINNDIEKKYEEIICNILTIKQSNDEF